MKGIKTVKWRFAQQLELNWWKQYLKNKNVEDYLTWKKNYWNQFLKNIPIERKIDPNESVLDAGCGPAGIFSIMNQKNYAVDPLLDQYENNLPHFSKLKYPQTTFITSQLEELKLNMQFDWIFCLNAINHTHDIKKSLHVLYEHLKPTGCLVLSSDLHNYNLLKWGFRAVPGDALHPQQHSKNDYHNMLTECGFKVKSTKMYKSGFIFDYQVFILSK